MCGSMVYIQSAAAEIMRGIKKEDRKKPQGKNIMSASATQGGHDHAVATKHYTQVSRVIELLYIQALGLPQCCNLRPN